MVREWCKAQIVNAPIAAGPCTSCRPSAHSLAYSDSLPDTLTTHAALLRFGLFVSIPR